MIDTYTWSRIVANWYFHNKSVVEISNLLGLPTDTIVDIIFKNDIPKEILGSLKLTQEDVNRKRGKNE